MANTIVNFRFRDSELEYLVREARRLNCAVSEVVRAALARTRQRPVTTEEVVAVRLPRGLAAATPQMRSKTQRAATRAAKKARLDRK